MACQMSTLASLFRTIAVCIVLLLPEASGHFILGPIEPHDEECFLIRTPNWKDAQTRVRMLSGQYELIDDNDEGITAEPLLVLVMQGDDSILYKSEAGRSRDSFHVPLQANSKYWLCVQNFAYGPDWNEDEADHPDNLARTVGLEYSIRLATPDRLQKTEFDDKHRQWMASSDALMASLREMVSHQDFMRTRESIHRDLTEKTYNDVLTWTLLEAMCVCGIAGLQILYFRWFLEKKRSY